MTTTQLRYNIKHSGDMLGNLTTSMSVVCTVIGQCSTHILQLPNDTYSLSDLNYTWKAIIL